MNRLAVLILAGALISPCISYAQHGRHADEKGQEETAKVINSLHYAMAVQAVPDQVPQFKAATKSTAAARKNVQELQQKAAANAAGVGADIKLVIQSVDQAKADNDTFVKNFTSPQKSLLKDFVKKLNKADSEVTKSYRELDKAGDNMAKVAEAAEKLEKALTDFQKDQADLGAEMGIQS